MGSFVPIEHAWEQIQGFNRDLAMTVAGYKKRLEEHGMTTLEALQLAIEWQREFLRCVFRTLEGQGPGADGDKRP